LYAYALGGFAAGGILERLPIVQTISTLIGQWLDRFTAKFGEGKVMGAEASRYVR